MRSLGSYCNVTGVLVRRDLDTHVHRGTTLGGHRKMTSANQGGRPQRKPALPILLRLAASRIVRK
jgi:hypothetical protein